MSKNEVPMTDVDVALLHTILEHVIGKGLTQFGIAILEAREIADETGDDRAKQLVEFLSDLSQKLSERLAIILETIPGVILPSVEEVTQMIEEAQAEKEFIQLIKTQDSSKVQLH
jgi:DNA-binding transcriptional regulator YbjK